MKITSYAKRFVNRKGMNLFGKFYVPRDVTSDVFVFIVPGISKLGVKRYEDLQKYLAHHSIPSFSFDYRGYGRSEGEAKNATISDFVDDALFAFSEFKKIAHGSNVIVMGYSVGSFVVAKIIDAFSRVKGIILVSPPACSTEAVNIPLSQKTIELVKSKLQSEDSEVFTILKSLSKRTLIIFGDGDREVPLNMRHLYKNLGNEQIHYFSVPEGGHSLLRSVTSEEKEISEKVIQKIYDFILKS